MSQSPTFIIAEAGVNHNGDVALARQLIDAALETGADAVKFQTWVTELLITSDAPSAEYQKENTGNDDQFQMLKALELTYDDFRGLKAYADERGILFLSTPDEEQSADFLVGLGLPLIKIGSGEVTNLPYLAFLAGKGLPLVLSTGMSTLDEVLAAVATISDAGCSDLTLLHCVSNYPADPADCNLRAVDTLREATGCKVGYSDHTMGYEVPVAAVARGACMIEKHLTLDTAMEGPDHSSSLTPQEFKQMVDAIRSVESALGDGVKKPTAAELETRKVVRKSILAKREIAAGEVISLDCLALKRSGEGGLSASDFDQLLGKRAKATIASDTFILMEHVE